MPLTYAERQARRRQKLKDEGRYNEFKRKIVDYKQKSQNKSKEEETKLPTSLHVDIAGKRRAKTAERVARWRAQKKEQETKEPGQSTFAFRSALGKAVHRANRALAHNLPNTPKRKKAVCQRLFANMTTGTSDVPKPTPNATATGCSAANIALVEAFYQRDDISRQAPGRKDIVTVHNKDGSKVKVQSMHLTSSVLDVFA